jgi:hypothetical protein
MADCELLYNAVSKGVITRACRTWALQVKEKRNEMLGSCTNNFYDTFTQCDEAENEESGHYEKNRR